MAVWALAALRQPLPAAADNDGSSGSRSWAADWCVAAVRVAAEFGPQSLAHGLSGMAALKVQPPAELMQVRGFKELWEEGSFWGTWSAGNAR